MTMITESRRISIVQANKRRVKKIREENSYVGKDKLELEIGYLQSTIVNCEWDLNHMLKGNTIVVHKLEVAKKQLEIKKEEYKKLVEEKK